MIRSTPLFKFFVTSNTAPPDTSTPWGTTPTLQ